MKAEKFLPLIDNTQDGGFCFVDSTRDDGFERREPCA